MSFQKLVSSTDIFKSSGLPETRSSYQSSYIQSISEFDSTCHRSQRDGSKQGLVLGSAVINDNYLCEHDSDGYSWDSSPNVSPPIESAIKFSHVKDGFSEDYQEAWRKRDGVFKDCEGSIDGGDSVGESEVLDDVSTWSLDTIRRVASDLHQAFHSDPHLSVSRSTSLLLPRDHNSQVASNWEANGSLVDISVSKSHDNMLLDQSSSTLCASPRPWNKPELQSPFSESLGYAVSTHDSRLSSWSSSESGSLESELIFQPVTTDDLLSRSLGSPELQSPVYECLKQSVHSSMSVPGSSSEEPQQRKLKMYQLPPQQDPQLEKKRLRAIKQWKKRQQEEQQEKELKRCLEETKSEVISLRQEAALRRHRVDILKHQLASCFISSKITDILNGGQSKPSPYRCSSQEPSLEAPPPHIQLPDIATLLQMQSQIINK